MPLEEYAKNLSPVSYKAYDKAVSIRGNHLEFDDNWRDHYGRPMPDYLKWLLEAKFQAAKEQKTDIINTKVSLTDWAAKGGRE